MQIKSFNPDFAIERVNYGIRLIYPKEKLLANHTVDSLFKLPFQVYFENTEQATIAGNERYADVCGFGSLKECIGQKWFRPFKPKTIQQTLTNDQKVIHQNQFIIVEESGLRKDEVEVHTLSIRMPWYDAENKIIGLFGISISLGETPLAESLMTIMQLGLLDSKNTIRNAIGCEISNVYLSKRQTECAQLLLIGMRAKEIAAHLQLSTRTIEFYIENIKTKLGCKSRTELVLKLSKIMNL